MVLGKMNTDAYQESGACISSEWTCDGKIDRVGASDEETCEGKTLFLCHNKQKRICYT